MSLDFKNPQVVVCVGKPKRGKSYAVRWMILKNTVDKNRFKFGIVFTKTKFNKSFDYLPDQYVFEDYDPAVLEKYLETIKNQDTIQPSFIIFDDIQGVINANDPVLTSLIACHRHYKISIFFCFQYIYGRGSTPVLRECTTYAILFNSKGDRTLRALYENFGQLFDNYNEFKDYFLACTSEPYTAMLYIQDIDNKEDNYLQFRAPSNMDEFKNIKLDY